MYIQNIFLDLEAGVSDESDSDAGCRLEDESLEARFIDGMFHQTNNDKF